LMFGPVFADKCRSDPTARAKNYNFHK
jgi:hypothetical protein